MRLKLRKLLLGILVIALTYLCLSVHLATDHPQIDCKPDKQLLAQPPDPAVRVLPLCPNNPADLNLTSGVLPVNLTEASLADMASLNTDVRAGGRWRPSDCLPRHNVAIVVPYRDRKLQLSLFLQHIHPFLKRQKIAYTIYLLEQAAGKIFNRGLDRNIGFIESLKLDSSHECTMFHDVDLLPLDARNMYSCPDQPRHVCIALNSWNNFMPLYNTSYAEFGHVTFFRNDHYRLVNGYSNVYLGWGAEDDDIHARVRATGMHIYRYPDDIGRYYAVPHKDEQLEPRPPSKAQNVNRFKLLNVASERMSRDGLNNLKYSIINISREPLYTRIYFDVEEDSYAEQAIEEEKLYLKLYGDLSPYWKSLFDFTPAPFWWTDKDMTAKIKSVKRAILYHAINKVQMKPVNVQTQTVKA